MHTCDECPVGDFDSMVDFVPTLKPTEDRDRGFYGGLVDRDRLEAALKGSIFLNALAVFVRYLP